jgi:hypothetical protein
MRVVRVDTLVLFLTLEELVSVTFSMMLAKGLSLWPLLCWETFFLFLLSSKLLLQNFILILPKTFSTSRKCVYMPNDIYWFLLHLLILSWCMTLFYMPDSFCRYFIENFASTFIKELVCNSHFVLCPYLVLEQVWYWNHRAWWCSFPFQFEYWCSFLDVW